MSDEKPPGPTRRDVLLDAGLALGFAGVAGSVGYPVIAYLQPPATRDREANQVVAARVDEIPPNGWKIFRFGTKPGLLVRTASGEYRAFSAKCTHLDCIVQYRPEDQVILCACHRGLYDLTGRNVSGPPPRPLEAYEVRVQGQDVVVSRKA